MKCQECETSFKPSGRGLAQQFCSAKCRMRAYRRRASQKRNVTNKKAEETIEALKMENERLRRRLRAALKKVPNEPTSIFPLAVKGGRWKSIESTSNLNPGAIIRAMKFQLLTSSWPKRTAFFNSRTSTLAKLAPSQCMTPRRGGRKTRASDFRD